MEVEHNKKSSTTAKTALGLGIGALGIELLNGGFNGILGNNACGRQVQQNDCGGCATACHAGAGYIAHDMAQTAALYEASQLAQVRAERYADSVGIATFKESLASLNSFQATTSESIRTINEELVRNRVNEARNDERIKCMEKEFNYKLEAQALAINAKIDMTATNLGNAIAVESERRATADNAIRDWTECNFAQYKRVLDSTMLCPSVNLTNGNSSDCPCGDK